jgi:hypothetical protein
VSLRIDIKQHSRNERLIMLTIIAARAIIPGVASWSPHRIPFGLGPDGFLPESDEGPKSITFNICVSELVR